MAFFLSMKTGAAGCSPVPGSEMPIFACFDSPGPFTMLPITATFRFSTWIGAAPFAMYLEIQLWMSRASSWKTEEVAAAARTGRHQRHEGAESHGLEQFLGRLDLERPVAAGLRGQGNSGSCRRCPAEAGCRWRQRRPRCPRAHAPRPGEAEMDGVVGTAGEFLIDGDQVLHGRDLRRQDDPVAPEPGSPRRGPPRGEGRLIMASRVTQRMSRGWAEAAFSFIRWVSSS